MALYHGLRERPEQRRRAVMKRPGHIFVIYHPGVTMLYISSAIVLTMLSYHPVYISVSFLCACAYSVFLTGFHEFRKKILFAFTVFLAVAVLNPLFNKGGITVLFRLFGNPVTAESVMFGLAAGGMLASVLIWFSCFNVLMTNEKLIYLFGKPLPSVALMLSMIMRLIPVTGYKARCIGNSQKAMGIREAGRIKRVRQGIRAASILMSWSMEDCIDTADSMKARGYGCAKRTYFSAFRWNRHDTLLVSVLVPLISVSGYFMLAFGFSYFPSISGDISAIRNIAGYAAFCLLLLCPLILEYRENLKWK